MSIFHCYDFTGHMSTITKLALADGGVDGGAVESEADEFFPSIQQPI